MRKLIVHFTILSLVIINYSCEKSFSIPNEMTDPIKYTYRHIINERQKTVEVINSYRDINYRDTIAVKPKETKLYTYDVQFYLNEVVIVEEDSVIYHYHKNDTIYSKDIFNIINWQHTYYYIPSYNNDEIIRYKQIEEYLFIIK